jgi:phosphonoacetaldehyde hydrolase
MDILIRNKPYTGRVHAVILDWAGTAVDYGCIGPVAVFIEVFRNHGVEITSAEARVPMGLMKKDHIRVLCGMETISIRWEKIHGSLPNKGDVEAMYREAEPLMASMVAQYSTPIPGLLEAVASLREQGVKVGSSTGYTRSMMEMLIPAAAEKGYRPDSIVCSSDVPAGRPYPWMCYQNAMNLQIFPFAAMVKIGDTVTDIQEGLNAGMWTIGVTKTGNEMGLTEEEVSAMDPKDLRDKLDQIEKRFRDFGAHFVIESVGESPAIIEQINSRLAQGELP